METSYYKMQYKSYPNGALSYLRQQHGWKQKPFANKPLPYWSRVERQTSYEAFGNWATGSFHSGASNSVFIPTPPLDWSEMNQAVTKARTKFLSSVGGSAELGTAIAEWRSSLELIATRARALREGYSHLKKGRFRKFLSTFNTRPRKKDRRKTWSRPKDASAIWIEYWFAWAPTVQDIYDSIDVIQNPASDKYVEAASGCQVSRDELDGALDRAYVKRSTKGVCIAKFGGAVTIGNPNLYQAQQLGLINPATVLWNITPFSWFVDWFSNVGVFLEGFSDTAGLSFKQLYLTKFVKLTVDVDQRTGPPSVSGRTGKKEQVESMFMERTLISTLPMPKLKLSLPDRLSETRAATAISLLILLFTSEKK